jgi:hypothetical protein
VGVTALAKEAAKEAVKVVMAGVMGAMVDAIARDETGTVTVALDVSLAAMTKTATADEVSETLMTAGVAAETDGNLAAAMMAGQGNKRLAAVPHRRRSASRHPISPISSQSPIASVV